MRVDPPVSYCLLWARWSTGEVNSDTKTCQQFLSHGQKMRCSRDDKPRWKKRFARDRMTTWSRRWDGQGQMSEIKELVTQRYCQPCGKVSRQGTGAGHFMTLKWSATCMNRISSHVEVWILFAVLRIDTCMRLEFLVMHRESHWGVVFSEPLLCFSKKRRMHCEGVVRNQCV